MCQVPIHVVVVSGEHGPTVQITAGDEATPARIEYVADLAVERWQRVHTRWLCALQVAAAVSASSDTSPARD